MISQKKALVPGVVPGLRKCLAHPHPSPAKGLHRGQTFPACCSASAPPPGCALDLEQGAGSVLRRAPPGISKQSRGASDGAAAPLDQEV